MVLTGTWYPLFLFLRFLLLFSYQRALWRVLLHLGAVWHEVGLSLRDAVARRKPMAILTGMGNHSYPCITSVFMGSPLIIIITQWLKDTIIYCAKPVTATRCRDLTSEWLSANLLWLSYIPIFACSARVYGIVIFLLSFLPGWIVETLDAGPQPISSCWWNMSSAS